MNTAIKTPHPRNEKKHKALKRGRLHHASLALILAGIVPLFCSFQSAQAVISSWTTAQVSPEEGCDVSVIVDGSLTGSSSAADQPAEWDAGSLVLNSPVIGQSSATGVSNSVLDASLNKVGLTLNAPVGTILGNATRVSVVNPALAGAVSLNSGVKLGSASTMYFSGGNTSGIQADSLSSLDGESGDVVAATDIVLNLAVVPEPATWGTLVTGFGVLLGCRRMRKHRAAGR